jgi:hypothetical protein
VWGSKLYGRLDLTLMGVKVDNAHNRHTPLFIFHVLITLTPPHHHHTFFTLSSIPRDVWILLQNVISFFILLPSRVEKRTIKLEKLEVHKFQWLYSRKKLLL